MAEVWTAGSRAKLMFVPWDSGYDKVVQWSVADRDAWFAGQPSIGNLDIEAQTYIRPNVPLTVNAPYSACFGANYLVVTNPAQPVDGARAETLCYFVVDTRYVSPHSTRLVLQLDVWQTRFIGEGAHLGEGFLEQGHWASYQMARAYRMQDGNWTQGLRWYAYAPEGLNIGTDYDSRPLALLGLQASEGYVIILSKVDLKSDFGSVDNPKLTTAYGGQYDGLFSGAQAYICHANDFQNFYNSLADYSWISQNMLGAYYVPSGMIDSSSLGNPVTLKYLTVYSTWRGKQSVKGLYGTSLYDIAHDSNMFSEDEQLDIEEYPKLMCYPYCVLELSCGDGSPVYYKPDKFASTDIRFDMESVALPPFTRAAIFPRGYDTNYPIDFHMSYAGPGDTSPESRTIAYGDGIDSALIMANFPQFSGVSDNYITYMASTAHTRAANYQSAGWSLAASQASSRTSYEQALRNAATAQANQQVQNAATDFQQGLNAVSGGIGALGSLATGNVGGAASGVMSTALGYVSSEASQRASNAQFANSQAATLANADANQQLAQYISQGNYANAIRQINAAVEDAALTPPSVIGQEGGDGFAAALGYLGPLLKLKRLNVGNFRQVCQYFKRYGYEYHQWIDVPESLVLNQYFSYWKLQDVTIDMASANETETDALRGIFAKGVTVFRSADALLNYNVDGNYHRR